MKFLVGFLCIASLTFSNVVGHNLLKNQADIINKINTWFANGMKTSAKLYQQDILNNPRGDLQMAKEREIYEVMRAGLIRLVEPIDLHRSLVKIFGLIPDLVKVGGVFSKDGLFIDALYTGVNAFVPAYMTASRNMLDKTKIQVPASADVVVGFKTPSAQKRVVGSGVIEALSEANQLIQDELAALKAKKHFTPESKTTPKVFKTSLIVLLKKLVTLTLDEYKKFDPKTYTTDESLGAIGTLSAYISDCEQVFDASGLSLDYPILEGLVAAIESISKRCVKNILEGRY